jgi:uncharacterized membrane protein YheB (UPF0754 family)
MNLVVLSSSIGIGAAIGYITNYIAIKLLFKPYKPIKIGNITVFPQGVIPREKEALARKVGEVVRDYILSEEEIKKIVTTSEVKKEIEDFLNEKIDDLINKDINEFITKEELIEKFSAVIEKVVAEKFPMFASLVNSNMLKSVLENVELDFKLSAFVSSDKVKEILNKEVFEFLESEVPRIFLKANIDQIVEERVKNFDEKTLEEMLFSLMKKHFGFINFAGAVLGGIIGFVQYFVVVNF